MTRGAHPQMRLQAFCTSADATLCVAADTDGQTLMRPSKVVHCA